MVDPRWTGSRVGWVIVAIFVAIACGCAVSPSISADPTINATVAANVALTTSSGHDVTVTITDGSGTVREAVSGTPGDGASVEPYRVVVTNDDADTIRLTWVGGPCDAADSLSIDRTGHEFLLVEPECAGDAIAFDRVLVLHMSQPIDAADVRAVLQDGIDTPG